ncbi:cell wall hydrolase [Neobacillus sp. K501]
MKKLIILLTFLASLLMTSPAFAYTVKTGDTMSQIAKLHNLTLQQLAEVNPQIPNLNLVYVGQNVNLIGTDNSSAQEIVNNPLSESERDLLARLVRAEAQTETFEGKVAVACVVLNRVEHPQFPDSVKDVIYQDGQFQPVQNGAINKPADEESIRAVNAALTDQRELAPGALFFYNPAIATSRWLDSRETTVVIDSHVFKK